MKLTREQAFHKFKYGIKLWAYPIDNKNVELVYIEVEEGHFEEFYHKTSTFVYYVIEGEGTFYLNGEAVPAKASDVIVVPPTTKIYYLGKMKLNLITTPAWTEENEVHVRFIEK